MRTIHFITSGRATAYQYYRRWLPIRFLSDRLRAEGIEITTGEGINLDADVIVGGNSPGREYADQVCNFPGRVVWDVDDDFSCVGKHNPNYDVIQDNARHMERVLERADAIWTTTDYLAKRLGYRLKTWHCPNLIDMGEAGRSERGKDVVWFGGSSHGRDLEVIASLPERMPETSFLFFGDIPSSLARWEVDRRSNIARCKPLLPNVGYMPAVPFERFWDVLRGIPARFGIALCPLDESDRFTRGKSPLKYLEATAIGCSVIAQRQQPYTELLDEWGNFGWLASTPDEWEQAIREAQNPDSMFRREFAWRTLESNSWQGMPWDNQKDKWLRAIHYITSSMLKASHPITWGNDT